MGVMENIIKIIIKADNQADKAIKETEKSFQDAADACEKGFDTANETMKKSSKEVQKVSQNVKQYNGTLEKNGKTCSEIQEKMKKMSATGITAFNNLSSSDKKFLTGLGQDQEYAKRLTAQLKTFGTTGITAYNSLNTSQRQFLTEMQNTGTVTKTTSNSVIKFLEETKNKFTEIGSLIRSNTIPAIETVGNAFKNLRSKVDNVASKVDSAFSKMKNGVTTVSNALSGLAGIVASGLGVLGMNSIKDMTLGLAMTREETKTLTKAIMGSNEAGEEFFNTMDKLTDTSLVSLNDLAQAMNTIKMSTGVTNQQLTSFMTVVNDIGQRAILMGKDSSEAISLMQAAGKGLNGEFEQLQTNFGITKQKLLDLDWKGTAKDVDGYINALQEALNEGGELDNLFETLSGKLELLKGEFRVAGIAIGNTLIPFLSDAIDKFMAFGELNKNIYRDLIFLMAGVSGFASLAPTLAPMIQVWDVMGEQLVSLQGKSKTLQVLTNSVGKSFLSWPLTYIVLMLGALAVTVYEVGKEFGWWSNIPTMLEAIYSGAVKVFNAMRNNKDVQEIFKAVSNALKEIGMDLVNVWKWVLSLFGISTEGASGTVDAVQSIINALSGFAKWVNNVRKEYAWLWPVVKGVLETFIGFKVAEGIILAIGVRVSNLISKLKSVHNALSELNKKLGITKKLSPVIDFLKSKFELLKNKINDVKGSVSKLWSKLRENVSGAISTLKTKFIELAQGISLAAIKEKLYAAYQWLVNAATAVWNALLDANPVMIVVVAIVALIGVLLYLYNTNDTVKAAVDGFFQMLSEFGGWLVSTFGPILETVGAWLGNFWNILTTGEGAVDGVNGVFQWLHDILVSIGEFLPDEFIPVWELLIGIFDTVWSAVSQIVDVFMQFMDGQISLPELVSNVWNIILSTYVSIGGQILSFIIQWAGNLWNQAVTAGSNFLNGISQYISQLPGKVWNWITETARKIIVGAVSWVTGGNQGAINTVNAVINHVKELPGKVFTEFLNIGNKIKEAFGYVVQKAKDFANGIKNVVLDVLGIHSPGILQDKIEGEFKGIVDKISDSVGDAKDVAMSFGEAIRDNVGDMNLSTDLSMSTPGVNIESMQTVSMGADTSNLQNGLADVNSIASEGNNAIMSSFDLLNENMNSSLNQMVTDNLNAYTSMQVNDSNTMNIIRANMSNSLNTMRTTTNTQLNSMLNTTKQTNTKVTSAWSQMGGSVIKTSENIKTKATGYFNQLSNTIGGFYRKLQNPSSWGSGSYGGSTGKPSTIRHVGHSNNMSNKIKSIFQRQKIDTEKISIRQAELNPFIDTTSLSYINPSHSLSATVSLTDLAKYGALKLPKGNFGGWDATKQNYKHIHDTANKWKMKTPNIGRYTTNGKFLVEQFETGVPQIDYNTFRGLAEDVYSQTKYSFYANSEKYGNWQTAFMSGAFNCSDGADSLVAMAHAFGLNARKVHGHWNNLGHFWAEVEGHKMDTTGWQQHRTWTPSQSHAGPAPRHSFWEDPLASLKELVSNDSEEKSTTVDETPLTLNASINLNHSVNLENVPENINEEELTSIISGMLEDTANDERWIDRLVNNQVFQDLDLRIKERIQNRENRNRGVIH